MSENLKINLYIFFLSLIFLSSRWYFEFSNFPNEEITFKIIASAISDSYFHYIKIIENFEFTRDFSQTSFSEKLILIPLGSVIIHTFFYILIGSYAFILCELIFVYIFMFIIFKLLNLININNFFALFISFFLINFVNLSEFSTIGVVGLISEIFFNTRFPRPLVTQTYYLVSLYLILKMYINNLFFDKKFTYSLVLLLGLIFSTSFFNFFSLLLCYLICFIKTFQLKILQKILENRRLFLRSTIIFCMMVSPFAYLILNNQNDYAMRMGIIDLNLEKKIFLIKYYFGIFANSKTITVLSITLIFYIFIKKKIYEMNVKILDFFLISFLSSIISPFIFILISNKISFINHFNNLILLNFLIFICILFIILVDKLILKKIKIRLLSFLSISLIVSLVILNFSIVNLKSKEIDNSLRVQKHTIVSSIKKNINQDCRILTFDNSIMTWLIMNDYKYIDYLNGTFTTRTNKKLEYDLIRSLKILDYSVEDLKFLLESKYDVWRLKNSLLQQIFWQTYQANSFYTYNSSQNFSDEEIEIINKTKPSIIHQFVIPIEEKSRIINLFEDYRIKQNDLPNYAIIDKKHVFWNKFEKILIENELFFETKDWLIIKFNNSC